MDLLKHVGKSKGARKNKFNRAQKLINNWYDLKLKMESFVINGNGVTLRARCAYGILLTMETGIRIGNESSSEGYVCANKYLPEFGKIIKTYGLTTLTKEHIVRRSNTLYMKFCGKKGVHQSLHTSSPILLKYYNPILQLEHPTFLGISYDDLYKFVKKSIGRQFTPKDIRTAFVNRIFVGVYEINKVPVYKKSEANALIRQTLEQTAEHVGHTKGVCKGAYVSKDLFELIKFALYAEVIKRKEKKSK